MWNAFDFSFIVIFLAYLLLRITGLTQGDRKQSLPESSIVINTFSVSSSSMAFDVLACGACILFPRYYSMHSTLLPYH